MIASPPTIRSGRGNLEGGEGSKKKIDGLLLGGNVKNIVNTNNHGETPKPNTITTQLQGPRLNVHTGSDRMDQRKKSAKSQPGEDNNTTYKSGRNRKSHRPLSPL